MIAGELMINLGITGADKTVGSLGEINKSMGSVKSMSLETKAAIIAMVYAFDKMISSAGQLGATLINFKALTGISDKTLQQWQYAAQQANVSKDEVQSSFTAMQKIMADYQYKGSQAAPAGLGFAINAGGLNPTPENMQNTTYMMERINEAIQKLPIGLGNMMAHSFGWTDGMIAASRRQEFKPETFAKAPILSDETAKALSNAKANMANVAQRFELGFDKLLSKDGPKLITGIEKMADALLKLISAMDKLVDKYKVFDVVSEIIQGWALILNDMGDSSKSGLFKWQESENKNSKNFKDVLPPRTSGRSSGDHTHTTHVKVDVFGANTKDHQAIKDMHQQAANAAYRQYPNYEVS